MATDEEKSKLAKLLHGLDVPELKLPERCNGLVKEFYDKYESAMDNEDMDSEKYENPYIPDRILLQENEKKLKDLLADSKRPKITRNENNEANCSATDPKRPWRTNSNREKLLRVDIELKQHRERAIQAISPLEEDEMKDLVEECHKETLIARPIGADRLRETVEEARKNLPNFMYRNIDNSTATAILPNVQPMILANPTSVRDHEPGKYIARPDTKRCFIRSLAELKHLRVLALEYAHIADGTGNALLSLLPVLRRPHFRLQLICREEQIPGHTDTALGVGGYEIPDTAWRRVAIICPDIYLFMVLFRVRDYDNVQRFLAPSMPLREVHLQLGIDLKITQRQDSDINCLMRTLAYRYASILVTLSIHQWRSSELPVRRVLEIMPHLSRFMYTGRICASDLHDAITLIACGVCDRLREFKIQIQDEVNKETYWEEIVKSYADEFKNIMNLYNIKFSLNVYKI